MGRKLYVGNLPYSATEQSLREAFAASGTVDSVSVITDRDTGQSKGFAFVEMATDQEAQAGELNRSTRSSPPNDGLLEDRHEHGSPGRADKPMAVSR